MPTPTVKDQHVTQNYKLLLYRALQDYHPLLKETARYTGPPTPVLNIQYDTQDYQQVH